MTFPAISRRKALAALLAGTGILALPGCGGWLRPAAAEGLGADAATEPIMAIENVLARFAQAIDGDDPAAFAAVFLPEGCWIPGPQAAAPPVSGRAAIRDWHAATAVRRHPAIRLSRHQVLNPVITVAGDRAGFQAWLQWDWYRPDLDQVLTANGRLAGGLERREGGWWLAHLARTCTSVHGGGPVHLLHNGRQRLATG
jgi:ketosteroid isomerase-like protein